MYSAGIELDPLSLIQAFRRSDNCSSKILLNRFSLSYRSRGNQYSLMEHFRPKSGLLLLTRA